MGGGDFLSGLGIKSVTVKGIHGASGYAFVNSVLAADVVGTVKLASVQQNNDGLAFGVIADESIKSVLDQLTGWKAASSIPFDQNEINFHVKIN